MIAESAPDEALGPLPIDISLLDGLEVAMSKEERTKLTSLLTSGDPEQLALAATILSGMAELCKEGIVPSRRPAELTASMRALEDTSYTAGVAAGKAMLKGSQAQVKEIRLKAAEVKQGKRLHPLPSRMPRYACVDPFDPIKGSKRKGLLGIIGLPASIPILGKGPLSRRKKPSLTFVDDEWDGSLVDAFTNISVRPNGTVQKQEMGDVGVGYILSVASQGRETNLLDRERRPRVVIFKSRNDAARKGLHSGDIVTHVNGKAFVGTSDDLITLLTKIKDEGSDKFNIVVNAEPCIAEALRLRALC